VTSSAAQIDSLSDTQVRELARRLIAEVQFKQATIDKLTHENAVLKRLKFAAQSERFSADQKSLLDETLEADLQAVAEEIERLAPAVPAQGERQQPRRQPLPTNLPRREVRHKPESTTCGCAMKRIGEDVAEKLDYQPGVFPEERHIRGKWVLHEVRKARAGAGRAARHQQGHPNGRPADPGAGGQVRRRRCIARKASSVRRASKSRARRWRNGWAAAACSCSRWSAR
jgi:hypothetical protein